MTQRPTPRDVVKLFCELSDEDQCRFLEDILPTAEGVWALLGALSLPEQRRFTDAFWDATSSYLMPDLLGHAVAVVRSNPEATNEELVALVNQRAKEQNEREQQAYAELAMAQFKELRDRKSSPETVRRNLEMCDLRNQDSKKWSLARLAKRYDITVRAVSKILENESKWRRLSQTVTRDGTN
jgi:hypothetical protein